MNHTISQGFDSRAMPLLSEPSTAPSAFSLWHWLSERMKRPAGQPRDRATAPSIDPRLAQERRAATDHTPR